MPQPEQDPAEEEAELDGYEHRLRAPAAGQELGAVGAADDDELVCRAGASCEQRRRAWDVYVQVVNSASVGPAVVHAVAGDTGPGRRTQHPRPPSCQRTGGGSLVLLVR